MKRSRAVSIYDVLIAVFRGDLFEPTVAAAGDNRVASNRIINFKIAFRTACLANFAAQSIASLNYGRPLTR